jgi:uncharacterized protein DUF6510
MNSNADDYLDGNAAAGELSKIFSVDVTAASGQCAHCGEKRRFAEAHFIHAGPRNRGTVRRVRECTPSSRQCSPGRVPRHARHDVFETRDGTNPLSPADYSEARRNSIALEGTAGSEIMARFSISAQKRAIP